MENLMPRVFDILRLDIDGDIVTGIVVIELVRIETKTTREVKCICYANQQLYRGAYIENGSDTICTVEGVIVDHCIIPEYDIVLKVN